MKWNYDYVPMTEWIVYFDPYMNDFYFYNPTMLNEETRERWEDEFSRPWFWAKIPTDKPYIKKSYLRYSLSEALDDLIDYEHCDDQEVIEWYYNLLDQPLQIW